MKALRSSFVCVKIFLCVMEILVILDGSGKLAMGGCSGAALILMEVELNGVLSQEVWMRIQWHRVCIFVQIKI
jgi:hypothetical protein